jgi:hypothetical protein
MSKPMMGVVGRIVSRGGKIAGLFLPVDSGLPQGIYQIENVLGELTIRFIGQPAMNRVRLEGLDIEGVFNERPLSCMTLEELKATGQL